MGAAQVNPLCIMMHVNTTSFIFCPPTALQLPVLNPLLNAQLTLSYQPHLPHLSCITETLQQLSSYLSMCG